MLEDGTTILIPNEDVIIGKPPPSVELVTTSPVTPIEASKPTVAAHQRVADLFAQLGSLVDLIITGGSPSLLVCGDAGIGKTYLCRHRLQASGLKEQVISADASDTKPPPGKKKKRKVKPKADSYLFVKGYSSPMGLYQTLHDNRESIIVFDDCDSVFKNAVSVNILKSALDSYDDRVISWASTATAKMGLDSRFEFKGMIIFLSNIPLAKLDNAVKSRSFTIEMTLSREELFHRMNEVLGHIEPDIPMNERLDALNHLAHNIDTLGEFNMRTLIKAIRIRHSNHPAWKDMVLKFA